jgi:tRNA modification GTPase
LFNALLGSERAIVTDIAGTTRDQIHERFTIGDIPVSLIDTAGLRETNDTVEVIGVERSRRTMADADLVLVMVDASETLTGEDLEIIASVQELNHLVVVNKIDKPEATRIEEIRSRVAERDGAGSKSVLVSAKTGEGLEVLRQSIVRPFSAHDVSSDAATAAEVLPIRYRSSRLP